MDMIERGPGCQCCHLNGNISLNLKLSTIIITLEFCSRNYLAGSSVDKKNYFLKMCQN